MNELHGLRRRLINPDLDISSRGSPGRRRRRRSSRRRRRGRRRRRWRRHGRGRGRGSGGWRRRGGLGLCLSLGLVHGDRRQNGRGSDADCGRCGAGLLSGVRSCGRLLGIGHNSRSLPQADEEDSTHGRESTMESIEIQSFLFRPSSRRRFALAKDTNSANRLQVTATSSKPNPQVAPRHDRLLALTERGHRRGRRDRGPRNGPTIRARVARPRMGWGRFLSDRYSSREGQVIEGDEGRVACLVAIKAWVCTQRATATAASNRRGFNSCGGSVERRTRAVRRTGEEPDRAGRGIGGAAQERRMSGAPERDRACGGRPASPQ